MKIYRTVIAMFVVLTFLFLNLWVIQQKRADSLQESLDMLRKYRIIYIPRNNKEFIEYANKKEPYVAYWSFSSGEFAIEKEVKIYGHHSLILDFFVPPIRGQK